MMFDKEVVNEEEKIYTEKVEKTIIGQHNVEVISRKLRYKINDKPKLETDLILIVLTPERKIKRTIGIELKETDFTKAIVQAVNRREYFNWFYIVIDLHPKSIVEWIFRDRNIYSVIKEYGIGIVTTYPEVMLLPSKFYNVFKLSGFTFPI